MLSPETAEKVKVASDQAGVPAAKWAALKARGWWLPFDWAMLILLAATLVTAFFWRIFGSPTALNLIAIVLVDIFIAQIWMIALIFRCACFVLETQADINLMPESAARIVAGYFNMSPTTPTRARK
jgi:uncharacterized membrane protein YoaK (UPF0700 family)